MTDVLSVPSGSSGDPLARRPELDRPPPPMHASVPSPNRRDKSPSAGSAGASNDPQTTISHEDASGASRAAPAPPANASNCRLLWRGKVVTEHGQHLYGIAIIAHLFSVSSGSAPFSPALAASNLSPFDDPFSSATNATASGADMCLGLEMLRGAPITVTGQVKIASSPEVNGANAAGSARKGKGKAETQEEESVGVETPTDVRVYIDERCPETVEWFQDQFCREGRQGYGVRLSAGGEEVVIFASYPATSPPVASTSTSSADHPLLPLMLLLGRPIRKGARRPRPDDPTPRENLFAKRLRKTASLPASAFPTTDGPLEPAPPQKRRRQSAKDKAIASLLGGSKLESSMPPPASRPIKRSVSSQPPAIAFPPPAPPIASGRSFSRSMSSNHLSSKDARSGTQPARQASLPPSAGLPLRRSSSVSATSQGSGSTRPFRRSVSRSSMLLESPPGSDDETFANGGDGDLVDAAFGRSRTENDSARGMSAASMFSRAGSRAPASPTPSLASLADQDEMSESLDAVTELRAFGREPTPAGAADKSAGAGAGGAGKRMARSSSLPVGQFRLAAGAAAERSDQRLDAPSLKAVEPRAMDSAPAAGRNAAATEIRNKNTIKKITMLRMEAVGCGKDHPEFKDVFSFTTRGVAFAMRGAFQTMPLSPEDRQQASKLIDLHLRMYLPSALVPMLGLADDVGAREPQEVSTDSVSRSKPVGPPSPKSLGDNLDEASQVQAPEPMEVEPAPDRVYVANDASVLELSDEVAMAGSDETRAAQAMPDDRGPDAALVKPLDVAGGESPAGSPLAETQVDIEEDAVSLVQLPPRVPSEER